MDKLNIAATGYPGTNKSWRFLHNSFAQPLLELAKACGDNSIISGCFVNNGIVSAGWMAINGELFPFPGGKLTQGDETPLYEKEEIESAAYNTDLDNDNFFDNLPTYYKREVTFSQTQTLVCNWGDLVRIKTIREITEKLQFFEMIMSEDLMKKTPRPFTGAVDEIPAGFQLCNGANGTPDLRNRFLVGAGDQYDPGATGGTQEVILAEAQMPKHKHEGNTTGGGSHTHNGNTQSAGNHTHSYRDGYYIEIDNSGGISGAEYVGTGKKGSADSDWDNRYILYKNRTTDAAGVHSHNVALEGGNHEHSFVTSEKGGNQAHENRPPYYALCWIIWVGI